MNASILIQGVIMLVYISIIDAYVPLCKRHQIQTLTEELAERDTNIQGTLGDLSASVLSIERAIAVSNAINSAAYNHMTAKFGDLIDMFEDRIRNLEESCTCRHLTTQFLSTTKAPENPEVKIRVETAESTRMPTTTTTTERTTQTTTKTTPTTTEKTTPTTVTTVKTTPTTVTTVKTTPTTVKTVKTTPTSTTVKTTPTSTTVKTTPTSTTVKTTPTSTTTTTTVKPTPTATSKVETTPTTTTTVKATPSSTTTTEPTTVKVKTTPTVTTTTTTKAATTTTDGEGDGKWKGGQKPGNAKGRLGETTEMYDSFDV
ncbi:unnamed protein product [Owenia fusiformis]|uniref:Uncharacterized protein n=1 Tax=Owenia fusiformis TaxID=6347 RepID=A0A8S4MYK0_OWEFU|nr:unnamed protein product [Owenia fusiformis]